MEKKGFTWVMGLTVLMAGCGSSGSGSGVVGTEGSDGGSAIAAGTLDPDFGVDGKAFYDSGNGHDFGFGVACGLDGGILVTGAVRNASGDDDIALWRFDQQGNLDSGFGDSGITTWDSGAGGDIGYAVTVAPDGKILVTGYLATASEGLDMALLRYNADGSLDTSFGNNGLVTVGGSDKLLDTGRDVAVDGSGRILLVGTVTTALNSDIRLLRFNSDGSLDTTFNGTGYIDYDSGDDDIARSLALDSAGRILVTGHSKDAGVLHILVLRYNADGTLDSDFAANGVFMHDTPGYCQSYSVAVDSQDRILVTGNLTGAKGDNDMALLRLTPDGILDMDFNGSGVVSFDWALRHDYGLWIAVDSADRAVVAGRVAKTDGGTDLAVWRFQTDGSLDQDFGGNGYLIWDGGYGFDQGRSVTLDAEGRIIVAGITANQNADDDMVVMRIVP